MGGNLVSDLQTFFNYKESRTLLVAATPCIYFYNIKTVKDYRCISFILYSPLLQLLNSTCCKALCT